MAEEVTEITEEQFQSEMLDAIERFVEELARNKQYYSAYLALKNAGHAMMFCKNPNGTIYYYLLTQPMANHEDETMMIA